MKKWKKVLLLSTCGALAMAAIVTALLVTREGEPVELTQGSSRDAVFIVLRENGIESDSSEVVIKNFYAGARAEMTYRIHNATGKAITPEIYWNKDANIADYSKADGAVRAPDYVASWLEIPRLSDIPPGQIVDFTIALAMPKDTKKFADKFGFQVGVAGKTEGKIQPAVGIWWLVSMR